VPRLELTVQYAVSRRGLPHRRSIERWMQSVLTRPAQVTVRFVGPREVRLLNAQFRGKDAPTNVLSFTYGDPLPAGARPRRGAPAALCGDLAICAQQVRTEARAQGKPLAAHFAHLVIHGTLHLLGHDHQHEAEAQRMEDLERAALAGFGYPDPYREARPPKASRPQPAPS
jgi:probable rRNA maturation factor